MLERKPVDTIFITSSASPDGKRRFNENLRHQRAQAIINYVEAIVQIPQNCASLYVMLH